MMTTETASCSALTERARRYLLRVSSRAGTGSLGSVFWLASVLETPFVVVRADIGREKGRNVVGRMKGNK